MIHRFSLSCRYRQFDEISITKREPEQQKSYKCIILFIVNVVCLKKELSYASTILRFFIDCFSCSQLELWISSHTMSNKTSNCADITDRLFSSSLKLCYMNAFILYVVRLEISFWWGRWDKILIVQDCAISWAPGRTALWNSSHAFILNSELLNF